MAVLLTLPAAPAWAEPTDQCTYEAGTLTVTIPASDGIDVTKTDLSITIEFQNPDVHTCSLSPVTIGDGPPHIRTLAIVGDPGAANSVRIWEATVANWGLNSVSNIARTIDLGANYGNSVTLLGTDTADSISASALFSDLSSITYTVFRGFAGDDVLTGTSQSPSHYEWFSGGEGSDIAKGGGGDDLFFADAGNDIYQGNAGHDLVEYYSIWAPTLADFGTDGMDYDQPLIDSNLSLNLTSGTGTDTGGGVDIGADTFSSIEVAIGGSGNDLLIGSAYNDELDGGSGNDTLRGRGGDDVLYGGDGIDVVDYSEHTYPVTVNLTMNTAVGSSVGTDYIFSAENVTGGTAGDILVGDLEDNTLTGGAGADTLIGMQGDDTFNGGIGVDTASYDDSNYWALQGDTLLAAADGPVSVNLTTLGSPIETGGAGSDTFVGASGLNTVENLTGSSYDDILTGSGAVNILNGVGGEDTIYGGNGNDQLLGGEGADKLISGDGGNDTIRGGAGDDADLRGGAGADAIWGDAGADVLLGGSEGDTLRGGDDNDTLVGGTGGTGVDLMFGDDGTDTISYDNSTYSASAFGNVAAGGGITFKLNAVSIQQNTGGAGTDVAGDLIEKLTGSSSADLLVGNNLKNTILGLASNDTLQGGDDDDALDGGGGTNKLEGQAGDDTCINTGGTDAFGWPKTC